jgi:hypothetical protein
MITDRYMTIVLQRHHDNEDSPSSAHTCDRPGMELHQKSPTGKLVRQRSPEPPKSFQDTPEISRCDPELAEAGSRLPLCYPSDDLLCITDSYVALHGNSFRLGD